MNHEHDGKGDGRNGDIPGKSGDAFIGRRRGHTVLRREPALCILTFCEGHCAVRVLESGSLFLVDMEIISVQRMLETGSVLDLRPLMDRARTENTERNPSPSLLRRFSAVSLLPLNSSRHRLQRSTL
jgi:hypothetical protein